MADDLMKGILEELASPMRAAQKLVHRVADPIVEELATFAKPAPAPQPPPAPAPPRIVVPARTLIVDDEEVGLGQIENLKARRQFIDEIDAYIRNKYAAARENPDEFYQRLIAQQNDREALNEETPFIRGNPRSAAKAMLGNAATVQSGTTGASAPEVVRWTGEDIEATNVTVNLGLIGPPPSGSAAHAVRPYGIVQWGTRGMINTVEVDAGLGCQFTLSGSFVSVQVAMDDDGSTNLALAQLMASLSFRNVSHGTPMTRTKYAKTAGAATTIQVPYYAKSVLFYTDDSSQTYTLAFKDWAGNTVYTSSLLANAAVSTVPIPLAGDVEQITVTPGGGTPTVRLVFLLAL